MTVSEAVGLGEEGQLRGERGLQARTRSQLGANLVRIREHSNLQARLELATGIGTRVFPPSLKCLSGSSCLRVLIARRLR